MRVLFTTQPGEGHLHPILPLATALQAAGHEVAVACAPSFCRLVEARGLRAFPMGINWAIAPDADWEQLWPQIRDVPEEHYITFVLAEIFAGAVAESALPDLLTIADTWAPDVIVRETCEYSGWLAAEVLDLPHASVEVTLFAFTQREAEVVAGSLARHLVRYGQPADDVPTRLFAGLHLSFVPPSFQDPAVPLPATAHALKTVPVNPLPGERLPAWIDGEPDRPLAYVTGGTSGDRTGYFEPIIAAGRELDVNMIVTIGRTFDPAQFEPLPQGIHVARFISQTLILPHADVGLNHGGFSSVLGALAFGVPQVIMPFGADQPVNACRAEALGTAIVLPAEQRSPEQIKHAVSTVLTDPRYRRRAQDVQAEIAALPGPERGVNLLERFVAARR